MPEYTALRVAIVTSGIHQYEIARRIGVSESTLTRILRGRRTLDAETAQAIRDAIAQGGAAA